MRFAIKPKQKEEGSKLLIFDLDMTLYDIHASLIPATTEVLRAFSLPIPPDETLLDLVGEPIGFFLHGYSAKANPSNGERPET